MDKDCVNEESEVTAPQPLFYKNERQIKRHIAKKETMSECYVLGVSYFLPFRAGAGIAVVDSHLYVIGGFDDDSPLSTCERYDFTSNTWSFLPELSCARGGVGVASMGGRIFAVGGHGRPKRVTIEDWV